MPAKRRAPKGTSRPIHLGDDRWRIYGYDNLGKRRSKVVRARTATDAARLGTRWLASIDDPAATGDRTLGDLLAFWWERKSKDLQPTTAYGYQRLIGVITAELGDTPLGKVTPAVLEDFYHRHPAIQARRYSANIFHPAFSMAMRRGWMAGNPATAAELPRILTTERDPPTLDAVAAITAALLRDGPEWFGVLIHVLAHTGARKGEALALRWDDIDFTTGAVRIARNVAHVPNSGVIVKDPKTRKGRRVVHVDPGTLALLDRWRLNVESPWVFPGELRRNEPLSPRVVDGQWQRIKAKHGITWRLHDVRHAVASHLLAGGLAIPEVSRQLGHSSPTITLSVYSHAIPNDARKAAELLSGTIQPS